MKFTSRLLTLCSVILVLLVILNALPVVQKTLRGNEPGATNQRKISQSSPQEIAPATITVNGQQWGTSTCFIGAAEGSSRFDINDLKDLGINTYHIYGGMSRWEAQNDSSHYGLPTIEQIKANPNVINWQQWDTVMTHPAQNSDYWWETAPRWQGNARTLFSQLQAAHIRVVLVLRNRDDRNHPAWSPNPPRTEADWNEWWEHVFATVYWLNVRNHYGVTDFEILNEPNVLQQGWAPQANQEEYFTLARYTYDAITSVFHTYLPQTTYHIYGPATAGGTWPKDALQAIPDYFDMMDVHNYGNFRLQVEQVHRWMNEAGHTTMPLWVTEWGSYHGQYDQEPFDLGLINTLIDGSFPGDDYVYGSLIFALYDFSTNPTGIIDYKGHPRAAYYAVRMAIRALQGCRPTYQSRVSNKNLLAITTKDAKNHTYLLVTNQSPDVSYSMHVDMSALLHHASGTVRRFDKKHLDTVTERCATNDGTFSLAIPASGAVLVELAPGI